MAILEVVAKEAKMSVKGWRSSTSREPKKTPKTLSEPAAHDAAALAAVPDLLVTVPHRSLVAASAENAIDGVQDRWGREEVHGKTHGQKTCNTLGQDNTMSRPYKGFVALTRRSRSRSDELPARSG